MKKPDYKLALKRSIPALVLMGWIFFLSSQANLNSGLGLIDDIGRKFVHLGTYALLTFLIARGIDPARPGRRGSTLAASAVLALLYAFSDEYHQSFIEGRSGSPIDVAIDGVGIGLMIVSHDRYEWLRTAVSRPFKALRGGPAG